MFYHTRSLMHVNNPLQFSKYSSYSDNKLLIPSNSLHFESILSQAEINIDFEGDDVKNIEVKQ